MNKVWRGLRFAAQGVLILFLAALLAYNLYVSAARASGRALPKLFGFSNAVIISGSMSGAIEINDVVIARERPAYAPQDVILFEDFKGTIVCHRIVGLAEDGFITKGDANNVEDQPPIPQDRIFGKVIWVLPRVGLVQHYARSPLGLGAITLAAAALLAIPYLKRRRQEADSPPA
jgi:signal peptidase